MQTEYLWRVVYWQAFDVCHVALITATDVMTTLAIYSLSRQANLR